MRIQKVLLEGDLNQLCYRPVLINTGPDPLGKHKEPMTAFNVGPSSAHLNGVSLAANDGPLLVVFRSTLPLKK